VATISSVAESPLSVGAEVQISTRAAHPRWITLVGLRLIVIVGAEFRLSNLADKSVTHVEMYVLGIRMPQGISVPGQRMTLPSVLTGTFSSDTHPPGILRAHVHPSWYSTPTFYYLNSGWYRYVGENYQAASQRTRHVRIWALLFNDEPMPKQMAEALSNYQPVATVEVPRARAVSI
jgi:hypothetical protein